MTKENDIYAFMQICEAFVNSSLELRNAASLCEDDPIKQDMISFVVPDFNKMWARSEGIKVLLEQKEFSENKEFIIEEMAQVTHQNLEMAKKIRDKLGSLDWS